MCSQLIPGGRVGGRGSRMTKKRMTVRECRPLIEEMEYERLINSDVVVKEALKAVENDGIVFLDEIDKVSFYLIIFVFVRAVRLTISCFVYRLSRRRITGTARTRPRRVSSATCCPSSKAQSSPRSTATSTPTR